MSESFMPVTISYELRISAKLRSPPPTPITTTQNSLTGSTRRWRRTVPVSLAIRRSSAAGNSLDKAVRRGVDFDRAMGVPPFLFSTNKRKARLHGLLQACLQAQRTPYTITHGTP